ncbi:MAG: dimethyl sulfoxide reductase anchor subunit [Alphaproteobacteria bacterium]|nr:dimethyl sulfoxide reductase anchor subunit [Alphaproteobacteria bacterium]
MKNDRAAGGRPRLQRYWDLRAACNFIGGGTGTGLVIAASVLAMFGKPFVAPLLTGLVFVALGLTAILFEIGRPWRALNVFFHPQTSWMTREGVMALPLFGFGAVALLLAWFGGYGNADRALAVFAGLTACGFLYCQARILRAAKGIPAWRDAALTPFILLTGLSEGAGVLALLAAFGFAPDAVYAAALLLCLLRLIAWQRYRAGLAHRNAPEASRKALDGIGLAFIGLGHVLAALFLIAALVWPPISAIALVGGVLLTLAGWFSKAVLITRAAATRGLAIPRTPVRGRGASRAVAGNR